MREPMSPTYSPEHAAREVAHLLTLPANEIERMRAVCGEDLCEFIRKGGTVEDLIAMVGANCQGCG